jgi:hypothetical protein
VTDPEHRVTLLNRSQRDGTTGLTTIDGSTYDPFNGKLLFTSENGSGGGVVSTALRWSGSEAPALAYLDGSIGRAGYEGVQVDKQGTVYLVEDTGGSSANADGVKQPNSFVYRVKPTKLAGDLSRRAAAATSSSRRARATRRTGSGRGCSSSSRARRAAPPRRRPASPARAGTRTRRTAGR